MDRHRDQKPGARLKDAARARATRPARPAAAEAARRILLDTLGCALAGREAPQVAALEERLSMLESGPFTLPGGRRLSLNAAAQVLAMGATWDEACEGHALAHGRPGVPAVAALLPLAVSSARGLDATVDALALAYEVGARAGAWLRIRPGMHVDGNWPALGVAAGAARLLGLDEEGIVRAIDIAACQLATSLYLPVATGKTARNTYLGHAAQAGLAAACAAAAGIDAPADALACYAEGFADADADALPDAQADWITTAYLKPHAAVRHVHYGAEMARAVRDELRAETGSISRIALSIYREATVYCGNRAPATPIQAQFSLSFGIAAMLRFGVLDASVYRPGKFEDGELRRLEALVRIEVDPAFDTTNSRGASLALTAGYKDFEHDVRAIPGDAKLPLTNEEVAAKFMRYASARVPEEKSFVFANAVLASEVDVKMRDLWDLLF
ncbi:MAG: MmgE/PrpD family protein [Burkholderiales bacterium]|nr:MmgE/PrpD family protein [Burkholderiales bacterium]